LKSSFWKWNKSVFIVFAAMNMNKHPVRINIGYLQMCSLLESESKGIDGGEASAVVIHPGIV
jgi:hypothetical protein